MFGFCCCLGGLGEKRRESEWLRSWESVKSETVYPPSSSPFDPQIRLTKTKNCNPFLCNSMQTRPSPSAKKVSALQWRKKEEPKLIERQRGEGVWSWRLARRSGRRRLRAREPYSELADESSTHKRPIQYELFKRKKAHSHTERTRAVRASDSTQGFFPLFLGTWYQCYGEKPSTYSFFRSIKCKFVLIKSGKLF